MNNPRLLKMASYRSKRVEESNLINFIDRLPRKQFLIQTS